MFVTMMDTITFLSPLALLLLVSLGASSTQGQKCSEVGWFGDSCQYKCHCMEDYCDSITGECRLGSLCVPGWFGPACQYADIMTTYNTTTTPNWLYDSNDTTCNNNPSINSVTVQLTMPLPFTWLRVHASDAEYLENFDVQFKSSSNGGTIDCMNKKTARMDLTTLDIHCSLDVTVSQITVTGLGVQSLCSLYISGGRNIAVRQPTWNSTALNNYHEAPLAVDGNTDRNWQHLSCFETDQPDLDPGWSVSLTRPQIVYRYVIHNRDDGGKERLHYFRMISYAENGTKVFEFADQNQDVQEVYTIVPPVPYTHVVSRVNITTTYKAPIERYVILDLCEVQVFGETECLPGEYGRDCENKCDNCVDKKCFVSTGACTEGCAPSYYSNDCTERCSINCKDRLCDQVTGTCHMCLPGKAGDTCDQDCPGGTYGQNCSQTCSINCVNQLCNTVTGTCDLCSPGKMGEQCDQDCPNTKYGQGCTQTCSKSCIDQMCDSVTGVCHVCPPGKIGEHCDQDCPDGTFGQNCTQTCSISCIDQMCDSVTGVCNECPPGKIGDQCDQDCASGKFGQNCTQTCSNSCIDQMCDSVTGVCLSCTTGRTGEHCDQDCPTGTYGDQCSYNCSQHCARNDTSQDLSLSLSVCHHVTGTCVHGCLQGYQGEMCDIKNQNPNPGPPDITIIYIGVGVGVVVLLALTILAVLICYRRRSRQTSSSIEHDKDNHTDCELRNPNDDTADSPDHEDTGHLSSQSVTHSNPAEYLSLDSVHESIDSHGQYGHSATARRSKTSCDYADINDIHEQNNHQPATPQPLFSSTQPPSSDYLIVVSGSEYYRKRGHPLPVSPKPKPNPKPIVNVNLEQNGHRSLDSSTQPATSDYDTIGDVSDSQEQSRPLPHIPKPDFSSRASVPSYHDTAIMDSQEQHGRTLSASSAQSESPDYVDVTSTDNEGNNQSHTSLLPEVVTSIRSQPLYHDTANVGQCVDDGYLARDSSGQQRRRQQQQQQPQQPQYDVLDPKRKEDHNYRSMLTSAIEYHLPMEAPIASAEENTRHYQNVPEASHVIPTMEACGETPAENYEEDSVNLPGVDVKKEDRIYANSAVIALAQEK